MAFKKPITLKTGVTYIKSMVWKNTAGKSFLLNEFNRANQNGSVSLVVNVTEVNGEQAVFNSKNNQSFTAQLVDGKIKLCAPGCSDCECTACLDKYALDAVT